MRICLLVLALSGLTAEGQFSKKEFRQMNDRLWVHTQEVSVSDYREFLTAMGDSASFFQPDSSVWNESFASYSDPVPFGISYFQHPAFSVYPVVGISQAQANRYCQWLTSTHKVNEGEQQFLFRLPTEAEWIEAARAGDSSAIFPAHARKKLIYETYDLRTERGDFLFNLCYPSLLHLEPAPEGAVATRKSYDYAVDGYMITAPVQSFPTSKLGLYHLGGNVSEMVAEPGIAKGGSWKSLPYALRLDHQEPYEAPAPWLGFRVVAERIR